MDLLRQDDVYRAVMTLWPRCRMVKAEFAAGAWLRLRNYGEDYVKSALKRHRAQYLDAIRPEWKTLFRELAGDDAGGRSDDFRILLSQVRKHMEAIQLPGCKELDDAEVFQNHLDANPGRVTGIRQGWREYFVDRGETPPGFLTE